MGIGGDEGVKRGYNLEHSMFEIFLSAEVALQALLKHHLQVPQKDSQLLLESS